MRLCILPEDMFRCMIPAVLRNSCFNKAAKIIKFEHV